MDYAEKIIFYTDEAKDAMHSITQTQLTVGFTPAFSHQVICTAVKEFPKIHYIYLQIIEGHDSIRLLEQVQNQKLDLAFIRTATFDSNLTVDYLFSDRTFVFVSPTHPLSAKTMVTMGDLQGQTMIHYSRSVGIWKKIENTLVGVTDLKKLEIKNIAMLKKFVTEGLGFSILPYFSIIEEVQRKELKILEYKPRIPKNIMSVYYTGSSRTEYQKFISCCKKHLNTSLVYSLQIRES
ncbi:substrate-binding domain-containing protein [Thermoactinomyces mirandus]|uniref:Substrate-binding domain-containing protein n=1 Tax=Thermoactinomyces mirandus TaxID=2756294 RepID=A0A7W1XSK7_9BACL|nr:substrate-binding domain-containing protein [Thermoactinomyces mirandus]MBA4602366.1 substrate-binding domain-containing protein [Thermoactinomyces mirandus]